MKKGWFCRKCWRYGEAYTMGLAVKEHAEVVRRDLFHTAQLKHYLGDGFQGPAYCAGDLTVSPPKEKKDAQGKTV